MKKIKAFCRDIRKRLDTHKGAPLHKTFELLELVIEYLERTKLETIDVNIEELVKSMDRNCGDLKESQMDWRKITSEILKDSLIDSILTKPQQYRIGNYFCVDGTLHCVEKIEATQINGINFKRIKPAILKHAILEDLGFDAKSMDRYELISGEKGILYHSMEEDISIMDGKCFRYCEIYKDIKYVHQLQNIHFDLMQSELKFG